MFGPNVLIAFLGAMGVLAAVLAGLALPHYPITAAPEKRESVLKVLQRKLDQADMQLTAIEFLRVVLLLGVGLGIAAYFLTGIVAAALVGVIFGIVAYWAYLEDRRETRRRLYQEALAEVVEIMQESVGANNTLPVTLVIAARHCAPILKDDFDEIAARSQTGSDLVQALRFVADRRRDVMCDRLVEGLIAYQENGGELMPILKALGDAIRGLASVRRRIGTAQSRIRWEARIVCLAPFIFIVILRQTAPDLQQPFYATMWGQLSVLVVALMCGAAYYLMNRMGKRALDPIESAGTVQ